MAVATRRWLSLLTVGCLIAALVVAVVGDTTEMLVEGVHLEGPIGWLVLAAYVTTIGAVALIGILLAAKVPDNPTGRILVALGVWQAFTLVISLALSASSDEGLSRVGAWLGAWTFVPLTTVPVIVVLLLFPSGRLLSSRWQPLVWLAGIGTVSWATAEASRPVLGLTTISNPFANRGLESTSDLISITLVAGLVGAAANIIIRFRRSAGDERLQVKWITLTGIFLILTFGSVWLLSEVAPTRFGGGQIVFATLAIALLFAAIGLAILKYRLYEIDRIISRTVSYSLVAGTMALIYAGVAVGLPQLVGRGESSPLATAAGTLAVAGLFRPLSRRLHSFVDHRFNRVRFDAQREVDGFAGRLGQDPDLAGVVAAMNDVVSRTLAPSAWRFGSAPRARSEMASRIALKLWRRFSA